MRVRSSYICCAHRTCSALKYVYVEYQYTRHGVSVALLRSTCRRHYSGTDYSQSVTLICHCQQPSGAHYLRNNTGRNAGRERNVARLRNPPSPKKEASCPNRGLEVDHRHKHTILYASRKRDPLLKPFMT